MKNQNSTQITDAIRPIKPNLDHRFSHLFKDQRDLTDTVHIMAARATSVLYLLSAQFESEDDNTLPSHVIYDSICSVICELDDMKAYLKAFSDAQKTTKNPR
jgi:hypothetical protein